LDKNETKEFYEFIKNVEKFLILTVNSLLSVPGKYDW